MPLPQRPAGITAGPRRKAARGRGAGVAAAVGGGILPLLRTRFILPSRRLKIQDATGDTEAGKGAAEGAGPGLKGVWPRLNGFPAESFYNGAMY